jgi:hypothetical protein
MSSRTSSRTCLLAVAALLGLSLTPVHAQAQGGQPVGGDAGAPPTHVSLNPVGGSPVHATLGVTQTGPNGGTFGASAGTVSSGGGGAPATTGPVVLCDPTFPHMSETIPLPRFNIASGPDTHAIVGLPIWFWTDPYDGDAITRRPMHGSVDVCSGINGIYSPPTGTRQITLYVDIWPDKGQWMFGDGTPLDKPQISRDCGTPTDVVVCDPRVLGREGSPLVTHQYTTSAAAYQAEVHIHFYSRIYSLQDKSDQAPGPAFWEWDTFSLAVNQIQTVLVPVPNTP